MRSTDTCFNLIRDEIRDSIFPAVVLILIFLPLTVSGFAFVDDYTVAGNGSSVFKTLLGHGRPFYALFNLIFDGIQSHSHFALLRGFNILLLLVSFFISKNIVTEIGFKSSLANAMAFMMVMTPGIYLFTWWATCSPQLIAVNCALLAVRFALTPGCFIVPSILAAIAMLTYQPAAMIYSAIIPLSLIKERKFELRSFLLRSIPYFISNIAGFFAIKAFSLYASSNRGIIKFDQVQEKLKWYFLTALPNSICLGTPLYSFGVACFCAILVAFGIIILFKRAGAVAAGVTLVGVLAASTPILLNSENWASSRALMPLFVYFTCVIFVGFAPCLNLSLTSMVERGGKVFLVLICSLTAVIVERTLVTHIVYPQLAEASYLSSLIREKRVDFSKEVFVIPSSWEYAIAPSVSYDEFGSVSSVSWNSIAMLRFQARRLGVDIHKLTLISPDEFAKYPEPQVLDLRKMKSLRVAD